jgi:hypothetical protein
MSLAYDYKTEDHWKMVGQKEARNTFLQGKPIVICLYPCVLEYGFPVREHRKIQTEKHWVEDRGYEWTMKKKSFREDHSEQNHNLFAYYQEV